MWVYIATIFLYVFKCILASQQGITDGWIIFSLFSESTTIITKQRNLNSYKTQLYASEHSLLYIFVCFQIYIHKEYWMVWIFFFVFRFDNNFLPKIYAECGNFWGIISYFDWLNSTNLAKNKLQKSLGKKVGRKNKNSSGHATLTVWKTHLCCCLPIISLPRSKQVGFTILAHIHTWCNTRLIFHFFKFLVPYRHTWW